MRRQILGLCCLSLLATAAISSDASARVSAKEVGVMVVDSGTMTPMNQAVTIREEGGEPLSMSVMGEGMYLLPQGVGRKFQIEFVNRIAPPQEVVLPKGRFDAVYLTFVMDTATGKLKQLSKKLIPRSRGRIRDFDGRPGLGTALGGAAGSPEAGGPPSNDDCANAIAIGDGTTAYSTVGATTDGPSHDLDGCQFDGQTYNDIWYVYTATCDGVLTVSTCDDAAYDTDLVMYDGADCGALNFLACSDDAAGCGGFTSEFSAPVTMGNDYLIRVGGFSDVDSGTGNLTLTCQATGGGNDECEDAIEIPCNGSASASNLTATDNPSDPAFSCRFGGAGNGVGSIWFSFVATDTTAFITTNLSTGASDTLLGVYDGSCGSLTEIACSEDEGVGLLSEVCAIGLTPGNTYYIQVASFSDASRGDITVDITCPCEQGRCCLDGGTMCVVNAELECAQLGGIWDAGLDCVSDPCPLAPSNDDCEDAISLALPSTVTFDNSVGTDDIGVPCGVASGPFKNVWYKVIGTGNTITATTCSANTAVTDTKISVFCGDCLELDCVAGNDDDCVDFEAFQSTVSFCSQAGAEYYITVGNFSALTTPGQIEVSVFEDGVPCSGAVKCIPEGACCLPCDQGCVVLTEADCDALGGAYLGDDTACAGNAIADGGFEGGTPNADWTEASTNFGTPICDTFSCGFGLGSGPNSGDFWAWFGGIAAFEAGSVEQTVVIPSSATDLTFFLEIPAASGNGTDFLRLLIDGNVEFSVLENAVGFFPYAQVSVDVSAYADDAPHTVRFESEISGIPGGTNFFVDDVELNFVNANCPSFPQYTLDFETEDDFATALVDGQAIDTEFGNLVTVSSSGDNEGAAMFDSTPGGPNDPGVDEDLLVDQGNIMILQEKPAQTVPGIFDFPDDAKAGGSITFDFVNSSRMFSIDIIDIDASVELTQDAWVILTDGNGNTRTYSLPEGWTANGGVGTLDLTTLADQAGFASTATASEDAGFDSTDVVSLQVVLNSSGACDNLSFCDSL